jgi:Intracellular proteinase inhibitor/S-layer homology domain
MKRLIEHWHLRVWTAVLLVGFVAGTAAGAIFGDVVGLPAQRAIERLAAKGIFRLGDEKFTPTATLSRADFSVLLTRVLELSGEGVALPHFTDAAEIPKDALLAVAAITNLGTVSPPRAEVRNGPLVYVLATDKTVYSPTDTVKLTFTISNTGKENVKFEFANSQQYDFLIKNGEGDEVARWSLGLAFRPIEGPITLASGKSFEYQTVWRQLDQNDKPVPPGRYELQAIQTTKSSPTMLSVVLYRGVLPGYADNTFRPKGDVTRGDLAAVIVRVLGWGETPKQPLTVTDADAIPLAMRGAVEVALERDLVTVLPDKTFQPARAATRAEVAWALDKVMDSLKRYDFSAGKLKDIRVGTPTLLVIEDAKQAQRTYRVARAHAVYRNNAATELAALKPGDALLFLKVGDVGDVAYIEATGN